jgi:hypothetical protein
MIFPYVVTNVQKIVRRPSGHAAYGIVRCLLGEFYETIRALCGQNEEIIMIKITVTILKD